MSHMSERAIGAIPAGYLADIAIAYMEIRARIDSLPLNSEEAVNGRAEAYDLLAKYTRAKTVDAWCREVGLTPRQLKHSLACEMADLRLERTYDAARSGALLERYETVSKAIADGLT